MELIKKYAKSTGKTEEELMEVYTKAETELKAQGLTDERIIKIEFGKRLSTLQWIAEHGSSTKTRREPIEFFGFILGATRLVDIDEFRRRKAVKEYHNDPENAKLMGIVDESGIPMDDRPTLKGPKGEVENPNYHKPLVSHTWTRTLYGIAMKGSEGPKFFRMKLWRGQAKGKVLPFQAIRFQALLKDDKAGFYELNPSKQTKFHKTEEEIPMESWIRKTCNVYPLRDLDQAHNASSSAIDRWILTEGDVRSIDTNINPNTGSRSILISDVDGGYLESVRVFVPGDFPLGFGEYSRVIVLGQTRKWARRDDPDTEILSIDSYGVFPIPGKIVEGVKTSRSAEPSALSGEEGQPIEWD